MHATSVTLDAFSNIYSARRLCSPATYTTIQIDSFTARKHAFISLYPKSKSSQCSTKTIIVCLRPAPSSSANCPVDDRNVQQPRVIFMVLQKKNHSG